MKGTNFLKNYRENFRKFDRWDTQKVKHTESKQTQLIIISRQQKQDVYSLLNAYGIYTRIDCILSHKTDFDTFKGLEIIQNEFTDYNRRKLEVRGRLRKIPKCSYKDKIQNNMSQK